ncbi:MAG: hypothetical protein ABFR63_02270 [Thermodesulfobacteriota bacterium]
MDNFMDILWYKIMAMCQYGASLFNQLLSPLNVFGPLFILVFLALLTLLITKLLNRLIVTRRYIELEKEFQHWLKIREEALKHEDTEEAKRLARNIDQAKLNKAYYDYFFEGFLLGLVRNVLPIILMVMYINEYYRAEELSRLFGRDYLFSFSSGNAEPILVGSVFTYLAALILLHICWYGTKKMLKRRMSSTSQRMDGLQSICH